MVSHIRRVALLLLISEKSKIKINLLTFPFQFHCASLILHHLIYQISDIKNYINWSTHERSELVNVFGTEHPVLGMIHLHHLLALPALAMEVVWMM